MSKKLVTIDLYDVPEIYITDILSGLQEFTSRFSVQQRPMTDMEVAEWQNK